MDHSQTKVLRFWERDYNSKFILSQICGQEARHTQSPEALSFDTFLFANNLNSFDVLAPINQYYDYWGHTLLHSLNTQI